jgi:hypothetical protein
MNKKIGEIMKLIRIITLLEIFTLLILGIIGYTTKMSIYVFISPFLVVIFLTICWYFNIWFYNFPTVMCTLLYRGFHLAVKGTIDFKR